MFDINAFISSDILEILKITVIIAIALIADRLISRYLRKIADFLNVRVETLKGLRFFFRSIILAFVLVSLASVKWFPTEYFVGAGAIVATVIGFASATTISNFLSGAYVLVLRVIRIGDYVKIGDIEGVVIDMSINYTMILTQDNTKVLISNKDIMAKTIYNYRIKEGEEEYFVYPVTFSTSIDKKPEEILSLIENIKKELPSEIQLIETRIEGLSRLEIKYQVILRTKNPYKIPQAKNLILQKLAEGL